MSVCLLLAPQLASAGSYQIVACDDAAAYGYMNNAWTYTTGDSTSFTRVGSENASCQSGGSSNDYISGMGVTTTPGSPDTNETAYWTLTAPSEASVTAVNAYYYLGKILDNDWRPFIKIGGTDAKTCDYSSTGCARTSIGSDVCVVSMATECSGTSDTSLSGSGSSVQIGVSCDDPTSCATGSTMYWAWSVVHGITVTLSESTAPSLSVSSSGFSESGNLTGTKTVSFQGSDARGIKKAELYVDGSLEVTSSNSLCDYTYVNPCADPAGAATTWNASLSYDVTSLSDGNHTAYVRIYDAADNTTNSDIWSFTTDNTPNTGSGSGAGSDGGSGSGSGTGSGSGSGTDTGGGSGSGTETGGGSGGSTDTGTGTSTGTDMGSGSTTGSSSGSTTGSSGSSGDTDSTAIKAATNLKIKRATLRNGHLTVRGTCARHSYTKRFRLTYDPTKGETLRRRFKCTKGRWSVTLKIRTRSGGKVRASYPGDSKIEQGKASRGVAV